MIKVSVMYPYSPEGRFDHDYYRDHHMPMVARLMGEHVRRYTIEKGLAGGDPGSPPTYVAAGHLYCDSVEAFQAGFGPNAQQILGDIPNYTDAKPILQISDVVVE
ncbi:MAG TPA: EthD family reductase [Kofleriaceae bacterium]|nr:EthD family reductase [Kofleriaceae bacterium]